MRNESRIYNENKMREIKAKYIMRAKYDENKMHD